jgi:uncharacterized phage protein (TIGR02220 family)
MSRYRKVLSRIWTDDKFPFLSLEARILFLYHLTSERATPFLLYVEGPGGIGDALRMPSARLRLAMQEALSKGLVWYANDGSNLLFLPNALRIKENGPESPNAVKTWVSLFNDLPKTPFLSRCLRHWACLTEGIDHALTHAFLKALPLPTPIQEQEQEQEQEQIPPKSPKGDFCVPSSSQKDLASEIQVVISRINELSGKGYRTDSKDVNKYLRARLSNGFTLDDCLMVAEDRWDSWGAKADMVQHFNPVTLFRPSNFEKYLVEAKADRKRTGSNHRQRKELPA